LNHLQEFERLKNEVKYLRDFKDEFAAHKEETERLKKQLAIEKREIARLRTENLQLKHLLEDEQRKVQEKDKELIRLERVVKDFESLDQKASDLHVAAARIRQNYAEETHIKDDRIKKLEERCQILEENNKRYRVITERLQEKSKEAEDHIRYASLQKSIAELEAKVLSLKKRRKLVGEQLSKAEGDWDSLQSGSGGGLSKTKSKTAKDAEARVDRLTEELSTIRADLKTTEPLLAKLSEEFEGMPNPADRPGNYSRNPSSGSYESQYTLPELVADISSRASGSPPQSDMLDTMETFTMDRDIHLGQPNPNGDRPWAKTVELSRNLSPREESFPQLTVRHKRGRC
jgi:chromosome segregation ATPase